VAGVKPALLKCAPTQVNIIYEHLRLDAAHYPDDLEGGAFFEGIVEDAKGIELAEDHLVKLREEEAIALAEHRRKVAEREAALRAEESDDEIVFSDEEDD